MRPERLPLAAWLADSAGTIVAHSEAFRALYGRVVAREVELWPPGARIPPEACGPVAYCGRVLHRLADGQVGEVELARTLTDTGEVLSIAVDRSAERRSGDALAAARAELERCREELRRAAIRDPVTGVWTGREFYRLLRMEIDRCRRYGRIGSVVSIQIMGFEALSERLAQHGTEQALLAVARAAGEGRRSMDFVGRLDGGRFGLVLPETPGAQATVVCERVRRLVEASTASVVTAEGVPMAVPLRVRVGVAEFPESGSEADGLLAHASRSAS